MPEARVGDLQASVLAHLLLMQNMLAEFPEEDSLLAFISRGLLELPGVQDAWFEAVGAVNGTRPREGTQRFALNLNQVRRGEVVVLLHSVLAFTPYAPFVGNLVFMASVILEERRQRRLKEEAQLHLEKRVEERTAELRAQVEETRVAIQEAQRHQQRATRYLEISEALIVELDCQGKIALINARASSVLGFGPEDLVGRDWFDTVILPEGREELRRVYLETLAGNAVAPSTYVNEVQTRSGETRTIAWRNVPRFDEGGNLTGTLSSGLDITERLRVEATQKQLQEQVYQAHKMESLGSLAGGIAHDMNNLLGAILSMSTLGLDLEPVGSPSRQLFETITRAAERGSDMVKRLLSFARQSTAEERPVDLNEILREEARILARTTLSRVDLDLQLAEDLFQVMGDGSALAHAIMNLCVNAVDAMHEQGRLTLRTRNLDEHRIEVQVIDSGAGMPREVLAKAFDPFFTTKAQGKGTGLGLSQVYSTVKAHRGEIELQSEPGQGTTVTLRLPSLAQRSGTNPSPGEAPRPSPSRTLRVLVVDDDELIQESTRIVLVALGHDPVVVGSGEEALALLERDQGFDAVLLDMNMPGLGGRETLLGLRRLQSTLPVFMATGRVDQAAMEAVEPDPHASLLPKPYTMRDLGARLAKLDARGRKAPQGVLPE